MASWYRKFIQNFASVVDPLINLLKANIRFKWGCIQEMAFEKIKKLLCEVPLLHRPDPNAEFKISTDASDTGLGCLITQEIDGKERVIAFASRALKKNEKIFSTTEKECLAIKWAI